MENRLIALVTVLSLAVGLVFGGIAGALWNGGGTTPDNSVVRLDLGAQDDFIIAAAEAYASDHDIGLAQDRLARLHSENISARVEYLAIDYALQRDFISTQLAGLAVALGSHNITLIAMNLAPVPTLIPPKAPAQTPTRVIPRSKPVPSPTPLAKGLVPANPSPAPQPTSPVSPSVVQKANGGGAAPKSTPQPVKAKGATPTRALALNSKPVATKQLPPTPGKVVGTVAVNLPDYVGAPALAIPLHAPPSKCTSPSQMPAVVDRTIALCPDQVYSPFKVNGNNLTIYGDPGGTARIRAPARAFGITVNGSNITITGVNVEAETDPADLDTWLCLYENCNYKGKPVHGAFYYGGGILLDHTTNVAVVSSTVSKGVIGVASIHGSSNKIVNNNLSHLNGWGTFLYFTDQNAVVGNTMNNVTRGCMGPDGKTFTTGCESAGIAAIRAETNLIVENRCEHSSNCIYASGEGGYSSNNNKIFKNFCAASPHNCYEITFSAGNKVDFNVATSDPKTGDKCLYPFWISGSNVDFGQNNTWNCKFTATQALIDSQHATGASTSASGLK